MTNREKYAEQILDIACSGERIAVDIATGEVKPCEKTKCKDCKFYSGEKVKGCKVSTKEWCNSRYIEKPKISRKDRMFLECIIDRYKYMVRDMDGDIYVYQNKPIKMFDVWDNGGEIQDISYFKIDFPMVRWKDEKPWLIEDLKNLKVVEKYENH